jgi:hypothetical protein
MASPYDVFRAELDARLAKDDPGIKTDQLTLLPSRRTLVATFRDAAGRPHVAASDVVFGARLGGCGFAADCGGPRLRRTAVSFDLAALAARADAPMTLWRLASVLALLGLAAVVHWL